MNVKKVNIEELNEASYNPRVSLKAGDPDYEKIKYSLEEFGYIEPIIWNRRTGNVVGGHQRLSVLRDMGVKEVDVVEVDLALKREKQLNVTLNKVKGKWDYERLGELLNSMDDPTKTGFDQWEIDALNIDYNHIEDLLMDDFTEHTPREERETFSMTFVLPIEAKEAVDTFLRTEENAKEILADIVLQHAQGMI